MGFFNRGKPWPVAGLHKDSATPMGTIWSYTAPASAPEPDLSGGELLDSAHILGPGDIINVRAFGGCKRFALRVTGRRKDVVSCVRVGR